MLRSLEQFDIYKYKCLPPEFQIKEFVICKQDVQSNAAFLTRNFAIVRVNKNKKVKKALARRNSMESEVDDLESADNFTEGEFDDPNASEGVYDVMKQNLVKRFKSFSAGQLFGLAVALSTIVCLIVGVYYWFKIMLPFV